MRHRHNPAPALISAKPSARFACWTKLTFTQTHKHTHGGRLKIEIIIAILVTLIISLNVAKAQTIVPAAVGPYSITDVHFPTTGDDDVVINCDMLRYEDDTPPGSGDGYTSTYMYAVAYSKRACSTCSGAAEGHVLVGDYLGNSVIINLEAGAEEADVALVHRTGIVYDWTSGSFTTDDYMVAVTYVVSGHVKLQLYALWGSWSTGGYPCFNTAWPLEDTQGLDLGTAFDGEPGGFGPLPHIDMFTDANQMHNGYPSVHKFVVTWATAGNELYMATGDFDEDYNTSPNWAYPIDLGYGGSQPDVAATTDIQSGKRYAEIAYINTTGATPTPSVMEIDVTNPGGIPGSATTNSSLNTTMSGLSSSTSYFTPRIEAMNQYDPTAGMAKWQVVVSESDPSLSAWQAYGYNSLSTTPTLLSLPFGPMDCKSPTVAAGVGNMYSGIIGNDQYTLGYFPIQANYLYARDVSAYSGSLISPSLYYQVNNSSNPVNYNWIDAKNYALSNSTNSGDHILIAYSDGSDLHLWGDQVSNTMSFKMAHTPSAAPAGLGVYPNPAEDVLNIAGISDTAEFSITDLAGATIEGGPVPPSHAVDVHRLPAGMYILRILQANQPTQTLKFIKQ